MDSGKSPPYNYILKLTVTRTVTTLEGGSKAYANNIRGFDLLTY